MYVYLYANDNRIIHIFHDRMESFVNVTKLIDPNEKLFFF